MIRVAIVEDEGAQADALEKMLRSYGEEHDMPISISKFHNAISFLDSDNFTYNIIFMDILMPMLNGMDAAKIIRQRDKEVMLVFITNMQQYAIHGYEVGAFDYILKPLRPAEFKLKFTRMLSRLEEKRSTRDFVIKTDNGYIRLNPAHILYIEVQAHHCMYHTRSGNYRQYQTLKAVEEKLKGLPFARCNNYLLVNLTHVKSVDGMEVQLDNGETLHMSNPRKNAFIQSFLSHMQGDLS